MGCFSIVVLMGRSMLMEVNALINTFSWTKVTAMTAKCLNAMVEPRLRIKMFGFSLISRTTYAARLNLEKLKHLLQSYMQHYTMTRFFKILLTLTMPKSGFRRRIRKICRNGGYITDTIILLIDRCSDCDRLLGLKHKFTNE